MALKGVTPRENEDIRKKLTKNKNGLRVVWGLILAACVLIIVSLFL